MQWFSAGLANMQIHPTPSNKIGPKTVGPRTDCSHVADTSSKGMHTYKAQPGYTCACRYLQVGTIK